MARSNTWKRKQAQRVRRRKVRLAKRKQVLASRIQDPFEVVLRVLMARGLPQELARKVVFGSGEPLFVSPTAQMMKKMAIGGGEWGLALDMFDYQEHQIVMRGSCMCQWHEAGDWTGRAAYLHCKGINTEIGWATPISLAAASHSQTIYQWRGDVNSKIYPWIIHNHDWTLGQEWSTRSDKYCGLTLLYYRFWRTMNERTDTEEMPIAPREYSLVRRLREAPMNELFRMHREAVEN